MSLPGFVPLPPAKLKQQIKPSEWNTFLLAWSSLAQAHTQLSDESLIKQILRPDTNVEGFLESFLSHAATSKGRFLDTEPERGLKQSVFDLIVRLSKLEGRRAPRLHTISFIEDLSCVYLEDPQLQDLVQRLWQSTRLLSGKKLLEWKASWIKNLEDITSPSLSYQLTRVVACVRVSPNCGNFLMEGSDFLDAMVSAWEKADSGVSRKLVIVAMYCLVSLIEVDPKQTTLLLDHLFSLKVNHKERMQHDNSSSLLASVLGTTPLLSRLTEEFPTSQTRGYALVEEFQTIARTSGLQRRHIIQKTSSKGKGIARADQNGEMHIHKISLVTQVQDLFPGLDIPRILQLLDAYNDDPERVIAHLLDDPPSPTEIALPPDVGAQKLPTVAEALSKLPTHPPFQSQVPSRRNIYDDEDLATLALDPSKLYTGRKPENIALQTPSTSTKAAILSALAAFDSDSDERDDTYDIDDVGGTIDTTNTGAGGQDTNANEETLYLAWKSNPTLFARDATARTSKPRIDLRQKTEMTDQSIEGWGVMLSRDSNRQRRLEKQYSTLMGQQSELQGSSWKANDEAVVDSEGEIQKHHTDRGRGGRIRGRGGPGRGRGRIPDGAGDGAPASTSATSGGNSTSSAQNTANQRRNKDANKGSRANHNRRDQRARKISRAGFPGL